MCAQFSNFLPGPDRTACSAVQQTSKVYSTIFYICTHVILFIVPPGVRVHMCTEMWPQKCEHCPI